jgi:hypothetical protein
LAKKDLRNTITAASVGDTIFVSVGTYSGGFVMREGITVMGGYLANPANPRERVLPANAADESQMSILDGEDVQRSLIQIADFNTPTFWDGFVIRNGFSVSEDVSVGSLVYAVNGTDIIAVVYQIDGENGKMISLPETKKSWGGYQKHFTELSCVGIPVGNITGKENTQHIIAKFGETNPDFKNNYILNGNYAARWCDTLSVGGFTDWYLPSAGEWQEIYTERSILNSILTAANIPLSKAYWTSNHAGELCAWTFYVENGKSIPTLKYIEKKVRAIRSFQKNELTIPANTASSVLLKNNGILNHCIVDGEEVNYVGVKDVLMEKISLQISPNPVKQNESFIVSSNASIGKIQLIDISGKVIFSDKVKEDKTSIVAPRNTGMYFLHLSGEMFKVMVVNQ